MKRDYDRWAIMFVGVVFTAGLALRLRLASLNYLNPDESMHALLAFGTWGDVLRNSLMVAHPPLLIVITHTVSLISRTELALRLVPVLAGSLFPLLLFAWLRRAAGMIAAMAALFLLTLAPHLITVSAQLRSYTLALLFLSASLVVLDKALESDRGRTMAAYSVLLWLCILSDYSMAWFAGAAGLYALLRLGGSSARVKAIWAVGQLAALVLYGVLFTMQVRHYRGGGIEQEAVSGWLRGAFPKPHEMLVFPFAGTLKQFAYLMASVPIGGLALVLFAAAVFSLWAGRVGIKRSKARAQALLLVAPFALAIVAAYAHQFPYGRSRHTLVLGLFAATGVAVFLQTLPRRAAMAILWGAVLLTPLWHWGADQDPQDISADRNRKELILQCLDYMRAAIPSDAVIFTERETLWILAYYAGDNEPPKKSVTREFSETMLGGRWRVATRDYTYVTPDEYRVALAAFRRKYGLGEGEPVWVLDGGWNVVSVPPDERRPFPKAVRAFQAVAP
jgi:hypothetical protein